MRSRTSRPTPTRRRRAGGALALSLTVLLAVVSPSTAASGPSSAEWTPGPALYGVGRQANVEIPMADGTVLRANVYAPTQDDGSAAPGPFPVIMTLTPYGKNQGDSDPKRGRVGMGRMDELITRGYIHAVVDMRGTGASEGTWSFLQPIEQSDGVELVDWAAGLPHSTGEVGLVGQSYAGLTQIMTAGSVGPDSPLKAIMPVVPSDDLYRDALTLGGVPDPLLPIEYAVGNLPSTFVNAITSLPEGATSPGVVLDLLQLLGQHAP